MATLASAKNKYVSDSVQTMSPGRMIVALYDRVILDLDRAEAAIGATDIYGAHTALMHAQEIVDELYTTLDVKQWPAGEKLLDDLPHGRGRAPRREHHQGRRAASHVPRAPHAAPRRVARGGRHGRPSRRARMSTAWAEALDAIEFHLAADAGGARGRHAAARAARHPAADGRLPGRARRPGPRRSSR